VSNDDVRQPTQPMQSAQQVSGQTDGQPAAAEIAEFFDKVAALGVQPRMRAVSGTCVFTLLSCHVTGKAGFSDIVEESSRK